MLMKANYVLFTLLHAFPSMHRDKPWSAGSSGYPLLLALLHSHLGTNEFEQQIRRTKKIRDLNDTHIRSISIRYLTIACLSTTLPTFARQWIKFSICCLYYSWRRTYLRRSVGHELGSRSFCRQMTWDDRESCHHLLDTQLTNHVYEGNHTSFVRRLSLYCSPSLSHALALPLPLSIFAVNSLVVEFLIELLSIFNMTS